MADFYNNTKVGMPIFNTKARSDVYSKRILNYSSSDRKYITLLDYFQAILIY